MMSSRGVLLLLLLTTIHFDETVSQRFMGKGFSNQMENDFRGEMQLDENEAASGMTREMFLMQDVDWELQPPNLQNLRDSKLKSHIEKYLHHSPLRLKLLRKQGKYGLRAVGQNKSGKKLRAFWRQGVADSKSVDYLESSYEEAVSSRLFNVEFEVQLPPMKRGGKLPSLVFRVPFEAGSMNAKCMVPRSTGSLRVYPAGRDVPAVPAGTCSASIAMKAGLVDPGWARGRKVIRKGRSKGFL